MKKDIIKKLFCTVLSLTIVTSVAITAKADPDPEIHPLGLNSLYEDNLPLKKAPKLQSKYKLPSSIDLSDEFPPVGNQGRLGSCVTFAIAYAYKTYQEGLDQKWNVNSNEHIFSPAYLFSQLHSSDTENGGGTNFSDAFRLLQTQGCTTLSDMPYDGQPFGWKTKPTSQQKTNASKYKIKSWYQLPSGNYNAIKEQLANGNSVVIGTSVYPDFDKLCSENPIYDDASGKSRGYHALCVVGYDDSKNAVKFINSWGTRWGLNGYGWMSYDLIRSQNTPIYVMTDILTNTTP